MARIVLHVIWILFGVLIVAFAFSYSDSWWVGLIGIGLIVYEVYGISQILNERDAVHRGDYDRYADEREAIRDRMNSAGGSSEGPGR